ncbi:M15 family metallopeptidase [Leptospira sp. 2 VSF19]|uniref:D-alanyl-D-alanine dipeptidase n=2 Tax=Leptospira soteropolitanensis TaxID=2950025 RepID=A0AAW5VCH4_9LEPT|nr:M15 family metallopeptidase [Leptospira soteropolitanensis]MCW7491253.1 M15 family metallopeptidase [Leptospira soteropolitanensis]MCW7498838.1 M15 family metallopeptidase [Leptospira soteropolitanensis]MCW7521570.1 M15 family metallopeptidase [Leptospira soteropolitanensis]MCW7524941.1 M15 family metallopeptidase [Leptospira soteropolitanensis]MCW7528809.1 M15 family metallopeptidase [Leptospira soteropolitanensis]
MKLVAVALCLGFPFLSLSSQSKEIKLKVLDREAYEQSIQKNPNKELINLEKKIPRIFLDIRYATSNNFTKHVIYKEAKAFARKPVAEALGEAQKEFLKLGYSMKIFDAYRPYAATVKFFEIIGDTRYVASPKTGSRHNKGCAIDLTLVDLKTKFELPMPTEYDSFRKEAWAEAPVSDPEILKNRTVLISTLRKYGFHVNKTEWWHFDFLECAGFEVLDIPFEDLE